MKTPLISIILPAYNVADHIERCLNSCLSQSFDNFEVIVVDDCGTDKSIEISNSFASKDSRIKIIQHKKNLGTYHARKTGTYCAKGSFILYLDPDDELAENALTTFSEIINKHPDLDLLLFNFKYIPSIKVWNIKPTVPCGVFKEKIPQKVLKEKKLTYGTSGKLYSKEAIIKGFDCLSVAEDVRLVYGEDALIFTAALLNTNYAIGISDSLYLYHRNETSITEVKEECAIYNNIVQLDLVISYLNRLKSKCALSNSVEIIINRMKIDRLNLYKEIAKTNLEYLDLMFKIVCKSKSLRDLVKVFIFFVTLTNKKL